VEDVIFKNRRRSDVSNYCGTAILSAIAKLFELLVYRCMYEDLTALHTGFLRANQLWKTLGTNLLLILQLFFTVGGRWLAGGVLFS
jgi:hypothetical protein